MSFLFLFFFSSHLISFHFLQPICYFILLFSLFIFTPSLFFSCSLFSLHHFVFLSFHSFHPSSSFHHISFLAVSSLFPISFLYLHIFLPLLHNLQTDTHFYLVILSFSLFSSFYMFFVFFSVTPYHCPYTFPFSANCLAIFFPLVSFLLFPRSYFCLLSTS